MKKELNKTRPRKLLSKSLYDLISAIMLNKGICPYCLSKDIASIYLIKRYLNNDDNQQDDDILRFYHYSCVNCNKEFDSDDFYPMSKWYDYNECFINDKQPVEIDNKSKKNTLNEQDTILSQIENLIEFFGQKLFIFGEYTDFTNFDMQDIHRLAEIDKQIVKIKKQLFKEREI